MPADIIVGLQWGDEGKGKMVDLLAQSGVYYAIGRYQGGHNAGHTVVVDDKKYVFHMVPSGVLMPGMNNVIGNGTVVDIQNLVNEIETLQGLGVSISPENFYISDCAHVIMPYHVAKEQSAAVKSIGTTGRGIGPTYESKSARSGLRLGDFLKLNRSGGREYALAQIRKNAPDFTEEEFALQEKYFEKLKPFVTDTSLLLNRWLKEGENILCEGAQGTFLDVDHGTYPFVTSSNSVAGGACTGLGISPAHVGRIIGIAKAYTTRVGNGPFPTELKDEIGGRIRDRGHEYGASTGRERRCGWEDEVVLRKAIMINRVTEIALMKLDVLDQESLIRSCDHYCVDGEDVYNFPSSALDLEKALPHYNEFQGWQVPTTDARGYPDLPKSARNYIDRFTEILDTCISFVSVGPDRKQTIEI